MSFTTTTVRFGARRVLVARPNALQYGHLGLEIVMALARAREAGADLYLVPPSNGLGPGLFELESPQIRVLRPPRMMRQVYRACISWREAWFRLARWQDGVRERMERELVEEIGRYIGDAGVPQPVREGLRHVRRRIRLSFDRKVRQRGRRPAYYERRLLREPVPVRLRPDAEREAERQARAAGIPLDTRLVCMHAREGGYKRGRELHEVRPQRNRDDRARNARIETYLAAADELVGRGYTVVRLGDPSMTPIRHPGVVDLATSPARTNLLEVFCLLRSAFIIAGESAYVNVVLTNTPILLVNATEAISAYPIRAPGLFLPKAVIEKRSGRRLTNLDLIGADYQRSFRDSRRYLYVDNSPAQIRDAACEMLDWLDGRWTESPDQRRYHEAITKAAAALRTHFTFARKWGPDRGFLGDGRISRVAFRDDALPVTAAATGVAPQMMHEQPHH